MQKRFFYGLFWIFVLWTCQPLKAQVNVTGRWSPVQNWFNTDNQPIGIMHAVLLPNGKVIGWARRDATGVGTGKQMIVWTPPTFPNNNGTFSATPTPSEDLFCSGHSLLADGRLFAPGGHIADFVGIKSTHIYDFRTNAWVKIPALMNKGRWYPTTTTLPNGDVVVLTGTDASSSDFNLLPQVYSPATNTYRDLTSARRYQPYYPWMFVKSDGKVFDAGPSQRTKTLDLSGTGSWSTGVDNLDGFRDYGTAVMYAPDKILIVGGSGEVAGKTVLKSAEVIDLGVNPAAWRYTKENGTGAKTEMATPRRQHNATLLPDGKVLITGGTSGPGFNNQTTPVRLAEMWDPATEKFTSLASISTTVKRIYHSLALLLPDGRVLSTGGGYYNNGPSLPENYPSAEIYSPPYLFNADGSDAIRPVISSLSKTSVAYGESFALNTPSAAAVTKVSFIRLGAVTHSVNMEQRFVQLSYTKNAGSLTVKMNNSRNICPPGYYMIFILTGKVPSVAKIIKVG